MTVPLVSSMTCVTISSTEPDKLEDLLLNYLDWETFCLSEVSKEHEELWGIKKYSAGNNLKIYRSKGSDIGMIRVIKGRNRIRNSPMSTRWSGVEIVVTEDLVGLCKTLEKSNVFEVVKPVDEADFTHAGANIHTFFHGIGPGLTHWMFTMAVTQPETYSFPDSPNRVGHIFDVHLDVNKEDPSRDFYQNTLNMDMHFDDMLKEGLFFDAWDLDLSHSPVQMSIYKGDTDWLMGGIEMRSFFGKTMDPSPPIKDQFDGGACMTTFTIKDIQKTYKAILDSHQAKVISKPKKVNYPPYSGCLVFSALGPKGERLEFSEKWEID